MAHTLATKIRITVTATASDDTYSELAPVNHTAVLAFSSDLTDGSGANKAQVVWNDERDLAASANDDLDLAGSLKNFNGNTITFTKVKMIFISNTTSSAASAILSVGGAGANDFINWVDNASDIINVA